MGAWPTNVPDLPAAERAMAAALGGGAPPIPELAFAAAQAAQATSGLERAALRGEPLPLDPGPLRRAAAMRARIGFALASAPPPGAAADAVAVAALLGQIDDLLSEVNALWDTAPEHLVPALAGVRNGLVKEAIDFSEAAQRYARSEVDEARRAAPPGPGARPAAGRGRGRLVAAAVALLVILLLWWLVRP